MALLAMSGLAGACAEEPLASFCTDDGEGFDIEEVSALESNLGWRGAGDAVSLTYEDERLAQDPLNSWRVTSVDVLVMIPAAEFDDAREDEVLEVLVFDGEDPNAVAPYRRAQTLIVASLDWSPHTFQAPPEGARLVDEFGVPIQNAAVDYMRAWWRFDLSDVIPDGGMTSTEYVVGVRWPAGPSPLVGYSFYNRSCADNWTNDESADPPNLIETPPGWTNNGATSGADACNWPMLKVNTELRSACEQ